MDKINNTMVQDDRRFVWCSACQNENSEHCVNCVFAGIPTKYKTQKPVIVTEGRK